ncbi:hypothetical protein NDU88_005898 [Pleurodeles waltl]|uniref:Uncharacterized protein n=1 Tax=Pleurodeles waltl TaxID=8319 RepID=A0AAV7SN30_PLEWA|nr:hypothetical protein NDU88_005898 [Pleurodeles waltl]
MKCPTGLEPRGGRPEPHGSSHFSLFSPEAGVPFSCAWSRGLFPDTVALVRAKHSRSRSAGPPSQRPPMESRSTAHSTQRAGIHDWWRALSPVQGAPHPAAARSTSASPLPVAAVLHRCCFGRERGGDPARPAPSLQSTFRHLSNAHVRSTAPIPLLVSLGAPVQSSRVWGPGLQLCRGGPDPVAILFLLGQATERARGRFGPPLHLSLVPKG